jgi:hypothetical protein
MENFSKPNPVSHVPFALSVSHFPFAISSVRRCPDLRGTSPRRDTSSARPVPASLQQTRVLSAASVGARLALARVTSRAKACRSARGAAVIPRTTCAIPLSLLPVSVNASASDVVDLAASLIGRPYVWGAEGPDAFDCSGLTQYVYQEFEIELPRRAISQSKVGDLADRRLRRGDLVFFATDSRQAMVTHVGIYEGGGIMIDASKRYGRVRRDHLNDPYWVERFMFARRIVSDQGTWDDARAIGGRRDEKVESPGSRRSDRRKAAARVLVDIAEALLRRPGRR